MLKLYDSTVTPYRYIYGCVPTVNANGVVEISPGQVRDDTNIYNMTVPEPFVLVPDGVSLVVMSPHVLLPLSQMIDTGDLEPLKTYCVFIVGDASKSRPPRPLISLSRDAPIMPISSGVTYSIKRLVGYISTNDNLSFPKFSYCNVVGKGSLRKLMYDPLDSVTTVFNGNVGGSPEVVALESRVPNLIIDTPTPPVSLIFRYKGDDGSVLLITAGPQAPSILGTFLGAWNTTASAFNTFGFFEVQPFYIDETLNPYIYISTQNNVSPANVSVNVTGYTYEV